MTVSAMKSSPKSSGAKNKKFFSTKMRNANVRDVVAKQAMLIDIPTDIIRLYCNYDTTHYSQQFLHDAVSLSCLLLNPALLTLR